MVNAFASVNINPIDSCISKDFYLLHWKKIVEEFAWVNSNPINASAVYNDDYCPNSLDRKTEGAQGEEEEEAGDRRKGGDDDYCPNSIDRKKEGEKGEEEEEAGIIITSYKKEVLLVNYFSKFSDDDCP